MQHMSADNFSWNGMKYTLLIDWYSRYCFLKEYRSEPDSKDVITFLEEIFHEYGYCEKLRTDGGPQFCSEFGDFNKRASIEWKPSSAYYAPSNGLMERSIGIVKGLLDKTLQTGESFKEAFLLYRTLQGLQRVYLLPDSSTGGS